MKDEQWLHKYNVKQRWGVKDDELVGFILHKGLKAYHKKEGKLVAITRSVHVVGGYNTLWDGREEPYYVKKSKSAPLRK